MKLKLRWTSKYTISEIKVQNYNQSMHLHILATFLSPITSFNADSVYNTLLNFPLQDIRLDWLQVLLAFWTRVVRIEVARCWCTFYYSIFIYFLSGGYCGNWSIKWRQQKISMIVVSAHLCVQKLSQLYSCHIFQMHIKPNMN